MISFSEAEIKSFAGKYRIVKSDVTVFFFGKSSWLIKEGFVSDGLSRPGLLAFKWGRWDDKYILPAIFHDWLLAHSGLPKWACDWLFMGALRCCGVSSLEAGIFWLAVRTRRPGKRRDL